MKVPKLKLPKISLPKISLKIPLPKLALPKIAAPKIPLPKFLKKKGKAADAPVVEEPKIAALDSPGQEAGQEAGEAPRKGIKRFLPKLKGKARVIVPVAASLLLGLLGGGGYFAWRMMSAPENAQEAAAPEGAGAEGAPVQKAEAEAAKPDGAASGHGAEAGHKGGEAAAGGHGEKPAEGGGHGGGGHGGGGGHAGGGKQKVEIAPLPPPAPKSEIEIMVRRLQDLQEAISGGDGVAFKEMPKHLRRTGRTIFEAPPEAWEKKENTHALIVYLLSGGASASGRKALAAPKFYAPDAPIAKAAVAYLENVEGPDRDFMLTLDPMALDPTLGGAVAFVQSILLSPREREAAVAKLDVARLLAPGGLVEEAALRREVGLLAEAKQYERFAALGRQYWARFRASPYAENFLRQFMLGVARVAISIKLEEWSELNDFVESLTPETKRGIYLVVAQNAAVVGNVDLARMAARRARDLSAEGSQERNRAIVYGAMADVGAADSVAAARLLDGVDRAQLPTGDQPLYDATAYVSGRVYRAPAKGFKETPPGAPNAADADLARAENLLKQGDAAIAAVRKTMARER